MFHPKRPASPVHHNLSERFDVPYLSADPKRPAPLPTILLHDLDVTDARMSVVLGWFEARFKARLRTRVAFLNAHCANLMRRDADYAGSLASADVVLPDGSGVALASLLQGMPLAANLNGTDLVPMLCARLGRLGASVYLLGGRPGVAEAAAEALASRCPGLLIAGTRDGFFGIEDEGEVVQAINRSGADLLLVARSVPLQDVFLRRVGARLNATLQFGVGGLFDFLGCRVSRAPAILRRAGLEWCWRLQQEPSRLWRRYVLGNPAYVAHALVTSAAQMRRRLDLGLKRAIDIVLSATALAVLAPALLVIAVVVRATSKGPALYNQVRIGQGGSTFVMLKFRSMVAGADRQRAALDATNQHGKDGITFKAKRDPRLTSLGRLLRITSIDELPQLFNVLRGDMSLVGPRPPLPSEVVRYTAQQVRRLDAKPGLTCLWQISGRAELNFERQVALDVQYISDRSLRLDLSILLRTIPAVLGGRGSY